MSAQPSDAAPRTTPRLTTLELPHTLAAVRAHLTDDEKARLCEQLENGDVFQVFRRWWNVAASRASPALAEHVKLRAQGAAGPTVPLGEVAARLGVAL
ncbi:hypothetical protein [Catenulispora pinisilvae]|uniref:hypothetical protein n=1 Tax=Catenulispora pinisilvae TaxID=2705253 RepID=UPI001891AE05|nr:hypothetical protein [Catenulispora pinisilvae]